ncbi:Gfo/Idh/MocA family protein [Geopsychrobacter electrodiphilus]|uniref:Gfo/Idh/MocA family protein n=1 Tax=Geopsychrobacter electrodiphilus TaxID=225196 RepID=UPI00037D0AC7|nr:Gfo/Idh/MocA family oxidoreductase [Geopsychrobacter electrodiphilus]
MNDGISRKNFALIGAGGYIAPRHMRAIADTGNNLICALDKNDSVGVLDSFSYDAKFFTEFERFDRFAEKLRRQNHEQKIHYVSICSPNYLHDAHIRFALRIGADAICEKPLVLNPWNLDALAELEQESGQRIYNILQLRVHPAIVELKKRFESNNSGIKQEIELTYITSRGNWYFHSWKGDVQKSGGIATNIGVHFFDMLLWIFGGLQHAEVHCADEKRMAGFLELENANIRWFLSADRGDLPEPVKTSGQTTYRSILLNEEEIEFSAGFTDLHTLVYRDILTGGGFGLEDARASISLVHQLRNLNPVSPSQDRSHSLLPFKKTSVG